MQQVPPRPPANAHGWPRCVVVLMGMAKAVRVGPANVFASPGRGAAYWAAYPQGRELEARVQARQEAADRGVDGRILGILLRLVGVLPAICTNGVPRDHGAMRHACPPGPCRRGGLARRASAWLGYRGSRALCMQYALGRRVTTHAHARDAVHSAVRPAVHPDACTQRTSMAGPPRAQPTRSPLHAGRRGEAPPRMRPAVPSRCCCIRAGAAASRLASRLGVRALIRLPSSAFPTGFFRAFAAGLAAGSSGRGRRH